MWKKYLLLLPVFYATASPAGSPVQYDLSAGLLRDDNITRAELDSDIIDDNVLHAGASVSYKLAINNISYSSFSGRLDINQYNDFDKLSSTDLELRASYHIKPFAGYTAIRYFILAAYEKRMVDSNQREGSGSKVRLGLSKRLTDLITLRLGIDKEQYDANNRVFETDNTQIYFGIDYRLTGKNTLYATFSTIDGDVVATAVPSAKLIGASLPQNRVRDDAFLELSPDRWAYRLDADTTTFMLGNIYSIDAMQALDISALSYDSEAYLDNSYSGLIIDITYLYRF